MPDWINQVAATSPEEPRGWFRWLDQHFFGRYGFCDSRYQVHLCVQGWPMEQPDFPTWPTSQCEHLVVRLARHAWTLGYLGYVELGELVLAHLTSQQQGAFIAGLSEHGHSTDHFDWIENWKGRAEFNPISTCQIACNAIRHNRILALRAVLNWQSDLTAEVARHGRVPAFRLANRMIDLVLEAALVQRHEEGAAVALTYGANPCIPIYKLERSYSEQHSALSYAVGYCGREMVEILLAHGAAENDFGQPNLALFLAIQKKHHDLAKRLLRNGADFTKGGYRRTRPYLGVSDKDLQAVESHFADLIPFTPIEEKSYFYQGNAQGGYHATFLSVVIGDLPRLIEYEALGMDTRLTTVEFYAALRPNMTESLRYLLGKYGDDVRDRALARIPEFQRAKAGRG